MTILITGSAGFIGFSLCKKLISQKVSLIGVDNLNSYYDVNLKKSRERYLEKLSKKEKVSYTFVNCNIENEHAIEQLFYKYKPKIVIHLAAQAGVRYSIENPHAYIESNIVGFLNILECCKLQKVKSLLYASSSSV